MPTLDELAALGTGDSGNGVYYWNESGNIPTQTADGQTAFTNHYGTFTGISGTTYHLPASGIRDPSSGALGVVGNLGGYWSGSAYDSSDAYGLGFYSGEAYTGDDLRVCCVSVRCVLN
jgi:hypothetical protein